MSKSVFPRPGATSTRARLAAAAIPVALLLIGYFASNYYFASREASLTLERLPEAPALDANTRTLKPVLDQALQAVQESPDAENVGRLGKLYQANFFFDEAMACYARAMELDPGNAQWPYLLGYLKNMRGAAREDNQLLDRAIELDPNYVPARLRRADNRYKAGDHAGAAADYERCLDLHATNAYARMGLGRIAADAEDWAAAEKQLRMAVEADNSFGTAYRLLATVYGKLGNETEQRRARAAADALGSFEPSPDPWVDDLEQYCHHTDQLLIMGDRAEKARQLDDAQAYYRRVLELDPDNFVANAKLGSILQSMHRYPEAAPFLAKAASLPARSDLRHSQINLALGNNYFTRRAPDKAVPHFQKALEQEPTLEAAHRGLAGCFLQLNRPQDAITHAEAALALNPDSDESHFNLGQARLMTDDVDGALPHFAEARRLNPNFPPPDFMAGTYYVAKGENERAAPYLERALDAARASGNSQLISQIQQILQQR